jgi:aminobenzoyl-glutamate utilization protein B
MRDVKKTLGRLIEAANGAALGTGTTVEYELTGGSYNVLPNMALAKAMQLNLEKVGGVPYTSSEREFATEIMKSYDSEGKTPEDARKITPLDLSGQVRNSSTDSGDVSWVVPLVSMRAATWAPGTSSHTWQAVAAGGTSIGMKGMMVAAKTLACTGIDLLNNPELIEAAHEELIKRRGVDFQYESLLGDRDPALDYMKQ